MNSSVIPESVDKMFLAVDGGSQFQIKASLRHKSLYGLGNTPSLIRLTVVSALVQVHGPAISGDRDGDGVGGIRVGGEKSLEGGDGKQ